MRRRGFVHCPLQQSAVYSLVCILRAQWCCAAVVVVVVDRTAVHDAPQQHQLEGESSEAPNFVSRYSHNNRSFGNNARASLVVEAKRWTTAPTTTVVVVMAILATYIIAHVATASATLYDSLVPPPSCTGSTVVVVVVRW
jgi:hypothetical protein